VTDKSTTTEKRNMVQADEKTTPPAGDSARVIADLREENARLKEQLAQQANRGTAAEREQEGLQKAAANTPRSVDGPDGKITIPDGVFLSEGMREELERTGRATDPATGVKLGNWPAAADDDTVRAAR